MTIENLFTPRGVVVIGSMSPGRLGMVLLKQLIDGGFGGGLYAVNPKGEGAFGIPGFVSVKSIGQPVDLAVVVSPAATVADVLHDCGAAGVGAAVVITSGFGEVGNKAGEQEILAAARQHGIRMVGPNCAGIVNTAHLLFPDLEFRPPTGNVALVSQSGALAGIVTAWADEQGMGISKFVSYGNGADLGPAELLRWLAADPETAVVALYIESVTDGRDFMDAVAECSRAKPVVVIKAGSSQAGQRAAVSHTGSLAGADAVYSAAIRQAGAVRVGTVEQLMDLCRGLAAAPRLNGRRVIIVTNSGGPGVLAADAAEALGLEVAEPSAGLKTRLREFLSPNCALKNPIDLTVEGTEDGYRRTLTAVLEEYDAVIAMDICPPHLDAVAHARGVLAAAAGQPKPVLANFLPAQVTAGAAELLRLGGIENFVSGERAAAVLARMADLSTPPSIPPHKGCSVTHIRRIWGGQGGAVETRTLPPENPLLEPTAMEWLAQNGIPVPPFRTANTIRETQLACAEVGLPAVMKVVSPDILHKSEFGGVVLDIRDPQAAQAAFEKLQAAGVGRDFRGVVVYPMIRGAQEGLIGLTRDPQFGPVIAFGLGGIYTEIWRDVVVRVAPVDMDGAREMIGAIRSIKLLEGARGAKPCDLEALAQVLVKVSHLPFIYPEIAELDLNPVFLLPEAILAGDVRVIRGNP